VIQKWANNADRRHRFWLGVCAGLLTVAVSSSAQEATASKEGLYRLSFTSDLDPLVINRMHSWTLHLDDRSGAPVSGADMTVVGGMPEHNHGLPTSPRVTRELGNGDYRLEGMRFHMSGSWEITVSINAADGKDSVLIRLEIQSAG
jgi:hypothetical protein